MILYGDYHTHTPYSHGTGTILENAMMAKQKGLKEIAITDHGFAHLACGIKYKDVEKMREEIEAAKQKTGINILLGVEANLISMDGSIDLTKEQIKLFDIILMGYHYSAKPKTMGDFFSLMLGNITPIIKDRKAQIQKNTEAIMRAIDKYPIDILTHMGYGMRVDFLQIARHAKMAGTYVELNGKRINFSEDVFVQMAKEGVAFVVNSDAHRSENVGECNRAMNLILKNNIDINLIGNVDKLLMLKRKR